MAPTKVKETREVNFKDLTKKASQKINITPDTQVVDARSAFEYSMMHIPGSIPIDWHQYAQNRLPAAGRLLSDKSLIARSLAFKGLTPAQPVVVIGQALQGQGEEGRVAWMLPYFGFKDVQVAGVSQFTNRLSNITEGPRENAKPWEPKVVESIDLTKNDFFDLLKTRSEKSKIHVIDVRTQQEYLKQTPSGGYAFPDLHALNIPWFEFYHPDGRPALELKKKLMGVGVFPKDPVVIISNKGVRSGAVTWALLSMGYHRVSNFSGGYSELLKKEF
ncbi:MAG: hypothetical protein KDD22_08815 [Bdellovibrionales bacterium]|nr:hypothetical protein [Bdellovibrionales bacterium]